MKFLKLSIYSLITGGLSLGLSQISAVAFTLDLFSDANDSTQEISVAGNSATGSDLDTGLFGTDFDRRNLEVTLTDDSRRSADLIIDPDPDFTDITINSDSRTTY